MASDIPQPHHEKRPWGEYVEFTRNTPSTVKIATINPGESLSLQTHEHRDEFWKVISGDGSATIGDMKYELAPGDSHFIPRHTAHRLSAYTQPLVILEISFGVADENDIVRLEDKYGRT
jgi:mannose-6-phosphate isomerase